MTRMAQNQQGRQQQQQQQLQVQLEKIAEEEEASLAMEMRMAVTEEAPPEAPREPMEFLCRSWSIPALELSRALFSASSSLSSSCCSSSSTTMMAVDDHFPLPVLPSSSSSSSPPLCMMMPCETSSPQTSGRLSQSSGGSFNAHSSFGSPPASPTTAQQLNRLITLQQALRTDPCRAENFIGKKFCRSYSSAKPPPAPPSALKGRTVGRWLKEMKEKRKEENRVQNAQLHAAMSVAGVASAVAAVTASAANSITSSTSTSTSTSANGGAAAPELNMSMAVASAAALVAAHCVEIAESIGGDRQQVASVVNSAINVRSAGDIITLTAGAATALRGAAILKARALKEVWNSAYVMPYEKAGVTPQSFPPNRNGNRGEQLEAEEEEDCLEKDCSIKEYLARGSELLKRTRKGVLHWKMVHVYIKHGQVIAKLKSKHMGNTFTKKKKTIVYEVLKEIPAWPGRETASKEGDNRCYFGLNTARGVIQFECRNIREHLLWTQGISRLLSIAHPSRAIPD